MMKKLNFLQLIKDQKQKEDRRHQARRQQMGQDGDGRQTLRRQAHRGDFAQGALVHALPRG